MFLIKKKWKMNQVNNPIERMKVMMKQVIMNYLIVLKQRHFRYIELLVKIMMVIHKINKLQIHKKFLKISRILTSFLNPRNNQNLLLRKSQFLKNLKRAKLR